MIEKRMWKMRLVCMELSITTLKMKLRSKKPQNRKRPVCKNRPRRKRPRPGTLVISTVAVLAWILLALVVLFLASAYWWIDDFMDWMLAS